MFANILNYIIVEKRNGSFSVIIMKNFGHYWLNFGYYSFNFGQNFISWPIDDKRANVISDLQLCLFWNSST